ncbi:MAG TPA: GH116 family glycosyl-hydrolase [Phycisphaerae bacterium]|nr:GH116 family glycosyl-hydrolase [Phycisphaerae bacterium]
MRRTPAHKGTPYSGSELHRRYTERVFRGQALRTIAFPLGGIGTGTISLGGYGDLCDWEIFNRPGKGEKVPLSFFAIWMRPQGDQAVARILEGRRLPPYQNSWQGVSAFDLWGLPRFREATFAGCYPFARVELSDPGLPACVQLEAFNPFIPLNEPDSSLPVAILRYTVKSRTRKPLAVSVAGCLTNVVGYEGREPPTGRKHPSYGKNHNEFMRQKALAGLRMTSRKVTPNAPGHGSMALVTTHTGRLSYLTHWLRGEHWDDMHAFWDDFALDGVVRGNTSGVSADGEAEHGSIVPGADIPPGSSKSFTFIIAWHFPNRAYDRNPVNWPQKFRLRNWHTDRFPDAWSVARYVAENLDHLEFESRLYIDTLTSSTLPGVAIDAAGSQASIIRTNTVYRTDDGRLYGYEGTRDASGSCPLNCTHVWNYEQTLAYLFPSLERTMRITDFVHNTSDDGYMAFRTLLPLSKRLWEFKPAADGQMGTILKLYREWQFGGDRQFLKNLWPHARRALEFAWKTGGWDGDRDGVMEGEQHNTYDIEFLGPNAMMGTLYLGALKAAAIMAREVGDDTFATTCESLFKRGGAKLDRLLFNGQWYEQKGVDVRKTKYQFGRGCLADQLLGQWFCEVVGLGDVLPRGHVRKALRSIYRHNFRDDLSTHESVQRTYAMNDEAGLLLCTWPRGGRPPLPFIYADEVWTGIEYQVAAHLMYHGLIDEGLTIVKAVRDRYDGEKRNPWNEIECGHHYARAMASWSLIPALSGYRYSAPQGMIGFDPRISPEDFACFFSTGTGWGQFRQKQKGITQTAEIDLQYGSLALNEVQLASTREWVHSRLSVSARKGRSAMMARISLRGRQIIVRFDEPVALEAGERLAIAIS